MNIKKAIRKHFNIKPFAEWAEEHGIEINKQAKVKQKPKLVFALRLAAMAAAAVLLISGIAWLAWPGYTPDTPRVFTSLDSITQPITLDELYQVDNILLFNREQVEDALLNVFRDVVRDEPDFILSYSVSDKIFVTLDEKNAFFVDFKVRVYRYYDFFDYINFKELSKNLTINETRIYYEIYTVGLARVRFAYGNNDYFLAVTCFFEGETTTQTLIILLNELFAN